MYNIFSWGANYYNQCGIIGSQYITNPTQIDTNLYKDIACGYYHNLAIDENDHLYAWGRNNHYQIGNNTRQIVQVPTLIDDQHTWIKISAGLGHSAAIDANNDLYIWGDNIYNNITNDPYNYVPYIKTPLKVAENIHTVSCGLTFTLFIDNFNDDYFLGSINFSQYGIPGRKTHIAGKLDDFAIFKHQTPYFLAHNIKSIYGSSNYFFLHDLFDNVSCFGYNHDGNLGLGNRRFSEQVTELTQIDNFPKNFQKIVTKGMFSFVIDENNETYITGSNRFGQLGITITEHNLSEFSHQIFYPVAITDISVGSSHTIFLIGGQLFGSGRNKEYQLFDDDTILQINTFTPIDHPNNYYGIFSGSYHNVGFRS